MFDDLVVTADTEYRLRWATASLPLQCFSLLTRIHAWGNHLVYRLKTGNNEVVLIMSSSCSSAGTASLGFVDPGATRP